MISLYDLSDTTRNKYGDSRFNSTRPLPSKLAQAVLLELYGTQMRSSILSGKSIGRNDNV